MDKEKKLIIRSSAAEFLIFEKQAHADSVEVRYEDKTLWLTQKMMAKLFDVNVPAISKHLQNVFEDGELEPSTTVSKKETVQNEGGRQVTRMLDYYSLDAVISVGYRVNSIRATQFRRWATQVLSKYAKTGYVLDRERMENGAFLDEDYFEHLLEEIREIRLSERRFYQKITDIYATSMDYDRHAATTKEFFATVQNKLHYAIHGKTAAELVMSRADSEKEHMGLTSWKNAPTGKIMKSDVSVAKNYLSRNELDELSRIVSMYLDYAESQARRHIPMTMEDWAQRLNAFLQFNEREILENPGKASAEIAKAFAQSEFEKYRITQDRLFQSDFDKLLSENEVQ